MRIQSDAEYARARATKYASPASQWQREAEVWFDGTVESVDSRLAVCRRLLADTRTAAANGITEKRLAAVGYYEQQHVALEHLRRQLLTAGTDLEAARSDSFDPLRQHKVRMREMELNGTTLDHDRGGSTTAGGYPAGADYRSWLGVRDRRWVALEAAKFIRANADVDLDELQIRAANHAQLHTGTLEQKRSRAITAAFVGKVTELDQQRPRQRVAKAPPVIDCVDEALFM